MKSLADDMPDRIINSVLAAKDQCAPSGFKKLVATSNGWRIRIGDYRVLNDIADSVQIVRVCRLQHRKDDSR